MDPKSSDDVPTRPVCAVCGKTAIKGGPIVPGRDFIASPEVGQCSWGDGWSYCRTFDLWRPEG